MTLSLQLQQWLIEVGSLFVVTASTTALHFVYTVDGFDSPFPRLTGAPLKHDPLLNFGLVQSGALGTYFALRLVCHLLSSAIPESVKGSPWAHRGGIAVLAVAVLSCTVAAIDPQTIAQYVVVKWLRENWERQGRSDMMWCLRLFVLLLAWQLLFATVIFVLSRAYGLARLFFSALTGRGGSADKGSGGDGGDKVGAIEGEGAKVTGSGVSGVAGFAPQNGKVIPDDGQGHKAGVVNGKPDGTSGGRERRV